MSVEVSRKQLADAKRAGGQYQWLAVRMLTEFPSNKPVNNCKTNGQSVPIWTGANRQPPNKAGLKARTWWAHTPHAVHFSQQEELYIGFWNLSECLPNYFPNSSQLDSWLFSVLCTGTSDLEELRMVLNAEDFSCCEVRERQVSTARGRRNGKWWNTASCKHEG